MSNAPDELTDEDGFTFSLDDLEERGDDPDDVDGPDRSSIVGFGALSMMVAICAAGVLVPLSAFGSPPDVAWAALVVLWVSGLLAIRYG